MVNPHDNISLELTTICPSLIHNSAPELGNDLIHRNDSDVTSIQVPSTMQVDQPSHFYTIGAAAIPPVDKGIGAWLFVS